MYDIFLGKYHFYWHGFDLLGNEFGHPLGRYLLHLAATLFGIIWNLWADQSDPRQTNIVQNMPTHGVRSLKVSRLKECIQGHQVLFLLLLRF